MTVISGIVNVIQLIIAFHVKQVSIRVVLMNLKGRCRILSKVMLNGVERACFDFDMPWVSLEHSPLSAANKDTHLAFVFLSKVDFHKLFFYSQVFFFSVPLLGYLKEKKYYFSKHCFPASLSLLLRKVITYFPSFFSPLKINESSFNLSLTLIFSSSGSR